MVLRKERQSGIELLRILAMFFVLVVHADFSALGYPGAEELDAAPAFAVSRTFVQALAVVCVNVFVMISGWFGIHPDLKGAAKFIFQCLFFILGIYIVMALAADVHLGVKGTVEYLLLKDYYWFVKSYAVLMIVAPVLNLFAEHASGKVFRNVLICFFVFQTIYGGWVIHSAASFLGGYSALSFMGLYLLARYVRMYPSRFTSLAGGKYFWMYMGVAVLMTVLSIAAMRFLPGYSDEIVGKLVVSYVNPFTILASLCLLLYFARLDFHSRLVNWIAESCFAVYLLHANSLLFDKYFLSSVRSLHSDGLWAGGGLHILLFLLLVFISGILIDKIRILLWNGAVRLHPGLSGQQKTGR